MSRSLALVMSFLCGVSASPATAQTPRICEGRACTPADFAAGVSELHDLKNAFVAALRQFAESASGSYGDEGPRLRSDLDALQEALESWDGAIALYAREARSAPQTADLHAALGMVYLDRLQVPEAIREFAAASRSDPRRTDIHELSAAAYSFAGDARKASVERAKARAIDAAAPFSRAGLLRQVADVALIFPPAIYVAGFRSLERGRLTDGVAQLRAALVNDAAASTQPASPSILAGARLRQGQVQAALTELRIASAAQDAEAQRVSGVAYWADEQYDKSIDALTAAVDRNPRDERARIALADVLVAAGRPSEAERTLKEAIALMPDSGQAHYRVGQLSQTASNIGDAIDQYEKAATCAPLAGLDHLFDVIGALAATQANFDRAVAAYRKRVDINPGNAEAHRRLGEIYALQGANEAALGEFAVAQSLNPRDADAYAGSAQSDLRLDRFADAARSARAALAVEPSQQKARFALGTALTRLGDVAGGQRELEVFQRQTDDTAARRRHALDVETLVSEGVRTQASGNYEEAARLFERALDDGSPDAGVEVRLATTLLRAARPDEALRHLAKALSAQPEDPGIHRLAGEIYATLGRQDDRDREEQMYRLLLAQRKEQRLKQHPLLR